MCQTVVEMQAYHPFVHNEEVLLLFIYLFIYLFIDVFIYLFDLFNYLPIYSFIYLHWNSYLLKHTFLQFLVNIRPVSICHPLSVVFAW